eukprot:m51a1_g7810 hypothetical protein (537) ;mRNA; r:92788-94882
MLSPTQHDALDVEQQQQQPLRGGTASPGVRAAASGPRWNRTATFVSIALSVAVAVVLTAVLATWWGTRPASNAESDRRPNVVVLIGDGLGPAGTCLARSLAALQGLPNPVERFARRGFRLSAVSTRSQSGQITDSAAGATAYACALRTYNGAIGVDPSGVPCGTLLEAARLQGYSAGVVVTKSITDATPAAFTAHVAQRTDQLLIASQQLEQRVDVLIGGGRTYFEPQLQRARELGYKVALTARELDDAVALGTQALPLLAPLANDAMPLAIDAANVTGTVREPRPSLLAMVKAALALLPPPYFLLIESSSIDSAEHANDAGAAAREIAEFFETVDAVAEHAQADASRRTLLVVTADHDTGGLALATPSQAPLDVAVVGRARASASAAAAALLLGSAGDDDVRAWLGADVTAEELALARATNDTGAAARVLAAAASARAGVSWATNGHSAIDVPAYTLVAGKTGGDDDDDEGDDEYVGVSVANIDVGAWIARVAKLDLAKATEAARARNWTAAAQASAATREAARLRDEYHGIYSN